MATSGSQGNTFRTGYRLQVDWVRTSVSTDGNYSVITAYLYLISLGGAYTISSSTTKNWSITIDGTPYSGTCTVGLSANESKLLGTASKTVYHNTDGYKNLSVSADCAMNVTLSGVYWGTVNTGTGYWDLDPIARASQPSLSASSIQMGSAVTIYTNRASTSFTHTIKYSFGNASGTIATGVTDSSAWNLPLATLAPQIPSSKSGVGTITVETYNGSTYIGAKTVQFTATISEGQASPTFANVTASELNSAVSTVVGAGIYVQNLSNIRIGFSAITYQYGASLAQCKINYNGSDYIASSVDTGTIPWTSSTITATVTDTRGFTCVRTLNLSAKQYLPPAISAFTVQRCLSDGTLNDLGTYVKITRAGTASTLVNGTEKNTITAKVYYSPRGANNWAELTACTVTNSTNVAGAVSSTPINITTLTFSIELSYDFRFDLIDKFYTTSSPNVLPVGTTVMSLGDKGVGIGKIWQKGSLDVAGDIYTDGKNLSYGQRDFETTITVDGNANTYYPVVLRNIGGLPSNNTIVQIDISRRYNAPAPNTWYTSTHKGSLTLSLLWNGWGTWTGEFAGYQVLKFNEVYSTMVGGIKNLNYDLIVYLRGGGAEYKIQSSMGSAIVPTVFLTSVTDSDGTVFAPVSYDASIVNREVRNKMLINTEDITNLVQAQTIIGSSGYTKLLSGLIISWGYYSSSILSSLPTASYSYLNLHYAFPNKALVILNSTNHSGSSAYTYVTYPDPANINTKIKLWVPSPVSSGWGIMQDLWYIAIGY